MIVGTGIDIVEIETISEIIDNNSRFVAKAFTSNEINYCELKPDKYQHYAVRFAAKEAVMKALGTGWSEAVNWKNIEVVKAEEGRPEVRLYNSAKKLAQTLNVTNIHLSLSHSKSYAIAMVIMEMCNSAPPAHGVL